MIRCAHPTKNDENDENDIKLDAAKQPHLWNEYLFLRQTFGQFFGGRFNRF